MYKTIEDLKGGSKEDAEERVKLLEKEDAELEEGVRLAELKAIALKVDEYLLKWVF